MKINKKNLMELIIMVIAMVGSIAFSIMLKDTETPINILLCLFLSNFIWIAIGIDIKEKTRG